MERLQGEIDQVDIGASAFPDDGTMFQDLWQSATARLNGREASAA